jgi:hypothetical protein
MMVVRFSLAFALCFVATGISWAETPYLDNRSTAEDLVRSLYNAINSHQFARAYDYFSVPPAKDFASFEKGYDGTEHVDVLTGDTTSDGAAGSIYYSVPTAIRAKGNDGKFSYFAGCYTVRAISGDVQSPQFRPYLIDKATLHAIKEADYEIYMLPKCGPETTDGGEAAVSVEDVKGKFSTDMKGQCPKVAETLGGKNEPESFAFSYRRNGSEKSEPELKVRLYQFDCLFGAYNEVNVFYIVDSDGLHRLSFARPHFDIAYADQDSAKLKSLKVTGYDTTDQLVNASFDPNTNMISDFSKWRGLADASSNGTWVFDQGEFVLRDYSVDPTFDDEQNPIDLMKNGVLQAVK